MRKYLPVLAFAVLCSDTGPVQPMPVLKSFPRFELKIEKPVKKPKPKRKPPKDGKCEADKKCGNVMPKTDVTIEEDGKGFYRGIITKVWNIRIETDDQCNVTDAAALMLLDDTKTGRLTQLYLREGECMNSTNGCLAVKAKDISYSLSGDCRASNKRITLSFSSAVHYK